MIDVYALTSLQNKPKILHESISLAGRLDTSVIYQLPCPSFLPIGQSGFTYLYPVSPELSTKQIGQSEGSTFKSVILKQYNLVV